jgi:hypothetical protein
LGQQQPLTTLSLEWLLSANTSHSSLTNLPPICLISVIDCLYNKFQRLASILSGYSPTSRALEVDARKYCPYVVRQARICWVGNHSVVWTFVEPLYTANKIAFHARLKARRVPKQLDRY